MVATFLLALFALVSSHAFLENLELIHGEAHHAESAAHSDFDHDAADGLCRIDSGICKVQKSANELSFSHCVADVLASLLNYSQPSQLAPSELASPPPELVSTWQFSSRAALPARAPSLV